ncbi:unnamed protein product [Menidia menidia]|uniref:(Atlantic silverside) hypothetical protein n=1 Tax=Menidia menidia TaxID=238744 RepID=A0A8S4AX53_9TELE|nr:unnamed protein product [Menidia menidia]CAG5881779.1 unnamed protein product [Menidia menidia]
MSCVQPLREFISRRLAAAATEICAELEKTLIRYEDQIDRQRRLLELTWKPQLNLHTIELLQHYIRKDEVFGGCEQERISFVEQESVRIKVEQDDTCSSPEKEPLVVKEEVDPFVITPLETSPLGERDSNRTHLVCGIPPLDESQDHEASEHDGSEPTTTGERALTHDHHTVRGDSYGLDSSVISDDTLDNDTGKKSVTCDVCGKAFTQRYNMMTHRRIHTGERPYPCKICSKRFIKHDNLLVHMRIHTGEKPYSCEMCGRSFARSCHLTAHIRTHSGEKPYFCTTCGKRFAEKRTLSAHMRIHTGERSYSCKTCGKNFIENRNLTAHMKIHSGDKPYSCHSCGKCFSENRNLTAHMRTHTGERPYCCRICGKSFTQSGKLSIHIRNHAGEKPYSCHICGKCFSENRYLTCHIRTHTGERPYACKICGKSFTQSGKLTIHMKSHSGQPPPPSEDLQGVKDSTHSNAC